MQGPAELLPVSSSAHTALLPWFAGWSCAELDSEQRNSLEVALHAGAAAALLIAGRGELAAAARELGRIGAPGSRARGSRRMRRGRSAARRGSTRSLDGRPAARQVATAALALAPPALVGYLLERRIERRPSDPRVLAAGLALGGAAMALADARGGARVLADAGPGDGLALGLAQALALAPGVSRNGATLAAARLRGFTRDDAQALSWRVGLPVILGAVALKARRLFAHEIQRGAAAGAGAAFVSTLASSPLLRPERRGRRLLPFSLYRVGLALLVVRRGAAKMRL